MKTFRSFSHFFYCNVIRKISIHIIPNLIRSPLSPASFFICSIKNCICNHPSGMYPGICPACTKNINKLSTHSCKNILKLSLYRISVWLMLPPIISASIITNRHFIIFLHCIFSLSLSTILPYVLLKELILLPVPYLQAYCFHSSSLLPLVYNLLL